MTGTMDQKTAAALRGSIEKWRKIADGTEEDRGYANCPLCLVFAKDRPEADICTGCPVFATSQRARCIGTPYEAWVRACQDQPVTSALRVTDEATRRAAAAELDFLRSLVTEERP